MRPPVENAALRIGQLADATGVTAETIRYYEREGVLPAPARGSSKYRQYVANDVERVAFVRTTRALGFTLAEVRALLSLADAPNRPCVEVDAMARANLAQVEEKLRHLEAMRAELSRVIGLCAGDGMVVECKILQALGDHPRRQDVSSA